MASVNAPNIRSSGDNTEKARGLNLGGPYFIFHMQYSYVIAETARRLAMSYGICHMEYEI
jgi:hypothetical protein